MRVTLWFAFNQYALGEALINLMFQQPIAECHQLELLCSEQTIAPLFIVVAFAEAFILGVVRFFSLAGFFGAVAHNMVVRVCVCFAFCIGLVLGVLEAPLCDSCFFHSGFFYSFCRCRLRLQR